MAGGSGAWAASGWRFAPPRMRAAPQPRRFAPAHRRDRPGGPALARLGPPGHSIRPHAFNYLYISRRIGLTFRPGVLPPSSRKRSFSYRWRFLIRLRQTPREGGVASRKKNGRLRARPPSARAIPSATAPGRFSLYIYREICLVATVEDALGLLYRTRQLAHGDALRFGRAANLRLKE